MRRLYEAPAYAPAFPDSHWLTAAQARGAPPAAFAALEGQAEAEVAVIGAGYAGLNAAHALAQRQGRKVVVLEARQPGWGASGRNGGFCCMGGAKIGLGSVARRHGLQGARDWQGFMLAAIDHVAAILAEDGQMARHGPPRAAGPDPAGPNPAGPDPAGPDPAAAYPEGEALLAHSPRAFAALARGLTDEAAILGLGAHRGPAALAAAGLGRLLPAAALPEAGLAGPGFHGALIGPRGFGLDPLAYVQALVGRVRRAGGQIHGDSPVIGLAPDQQGLGWIVTLPQGRLRARQVLIATNGYGEDDLPPVLARRRLPVLSSVLVTPPLSATQRRDQGFTSGLMAYDSRVLLHYFRHLPDGRFLFGMRGGIRADGAGLAATAARVRAHFARLFPAWAGIAPESQWSGLACLTASLAPYVGPLPGQGGLFAAFGWHGNGVAMASYCGDLVAGLMAKADAARARAQAGPRAIMGSAASLAGQDQRPLPALLASLPPRFALPRRAALATAYGLAWLGDGALPKPPKQQAPF